ncbi:Chemotaxis phosphatase CheX [Jatrophihabitans endophyticus]|uniref:Chemotaxis phosphatase CheX n=1 Tax=Jatrophihabitans endophyticus TaxID=1206085 RepID=A0A1M5III0_9ACTN|nr:chemotaxis protein CheX [Jatrophihabitans endophyticus]SHG28112.1 Chemotaxis phosphatase CheX [Jatrophihabitans endophyticus]
MTAAIEVDVDSLGSITTDVWTSFVAEDAVVLPLDDVPLHALTDVSSRVVIEGDASGCVVVRCDPSSAAALARRLFRLGDSVEPDDEDVADALGEMANIVGGNVKSLGLGDSRLTLPAVGASGEVENGDRLVCAADVIWEDGRAILFVGLPYQP